MKHFKILGLIAVAAVATTVLATPASADYVKTTTDGSAATPTIHAVNEGHITLKNVIADISCASTIEGSVVDHGPGESVDVDLTTWSFTGCTNSWHVTTKAPGDLSISWAPPSGHHGIVLSEGADIYATRFGIPCVYETNIAGFGPVFGGAPAEFELMATFQINQEASSELCGFSAESEGRYKATSALYVANS